jgi:branched-chain amino acid transport system permease protein
MLSNLIQAVFLGGYYAMLAIGLSFMFSVMRIINLAHGSLAILSAYLLFVLASKFGINPFLGLPIVIPLMAALGWILQRYILDRSARGGELLPVLTTFGLAILTDNLMFQRFGADTRSLAPYIGDLSFDAYDLPGGLFVGKLQVLVFITVIVVIAALQLFLKKTQLGRSIRATAMDPDTAGLVGIDAKHASAVAAAIAMATVTLAGAFLGMRGTFQPYSGGMQLLSAFEATVIGGLGSLWGTLFGGFVLAVAQTMGATIHPQGFLLGGHFAFLAVLFIRLFRNRIFSFGWLKRKRS